MRRGVSRMNARSGIVNGRRATRQADGWLNGSRPPTMTTTFAGSRTRTSSTATTTLPSCFGGGHSRRRLPGGAKPQLKAYQR